MDLWWKMAGYVRLRLTSADCASRLRLLAEQGIRLEEIRYVSELAVEFTILRRELKRAEDLLERRGERPEVLGRGGAVERITGWCRYPIILGTLALMLWGTMWIPGRILFIRVQGNGDIPARQIIAEAAECGVYFGASRRELRSEQVKNKLLYAIPELSWAGVNTSGCVATITVRPRAQEPEQAGEAGPASMVALRDAVVTEVTVTGGTGLCQPGQAVQAGQVLISGYSDLGICTRVQRAAGEVYGMTARQIRAVLPEETGQIVQTGQTVEKYSLLIGKKRINFDSDSGILYTSCGKMREVRWLTLPGGWELPIALVVERYDLTEVVPAQRTDCEGVLEDTVRRSLLRDMVAGEILSARTETSQDGGCWVLDGSYECREMIGRLRQGVYLEGDTNDDRENGERGAG